MNHDHIGAFLMFFGAVGLTVACFRVHLGEIRMARASKEQRRTTKENS